MMPLSMAPENMNLIIMKVNGRDEHKKKLETMGFVCEEPIKLISQSGGNVIVGIKDGRIALAEGMARRIMVKEAKAC